MSTDANAEAPGQARHRSRRPSASSRARGPGRGPMGGGMIGQKADTFWPSLKRLLARLRPERAKTYAVLALTVRQRRRHRGRARRSSAARPT